MTDRERRDECSSRAAEPAAANEEVRRCRQELQEYLDSLSTLTAKVAVDGTLLHVNRIARQASGLSDEQLMKTNFLEGPWWAFDPAVQARIRQAFQRASAGTPVQEEEKAFVFGEVRTMRFGLVPVAGPDGQVAYLVAEGQDVTLLKRAEEALARRTAELEATTRELESFVYSVSHDLRAPLRAIDGFSKILLDEYGEQVPAEALRLLRLVRDGARQMSSLVEDLLELSRLGRHPLEPRALAPSEVVRQALHELRAELDGRHVEVTVGDLPGCHADPRLLQSVFGNLLANALKFTRRRDAARIEVGGQATEAELVYFVRDNGVGFDMRYAHKLFGVFQRLHSRDEYEGTGVGLAIVQRIVHNHGGRVWAEARPEEGATFFFALPRGDRNE